MSPRLTHTDGKITYQPACQGLRALRTDEQTRSLLAEIADAKVLCRTRSQRCGFGGLFSADA